MSASMLSDKPSDKRSGNHHKQTHTLEFFFDCSSPWSYLAFAGIQPILKRYQQQPNFILHWRPVLVGAVFNAVNQAFYQRRSQPDPRQQAYADKDLQDWFAYCQLDLNWPSVFPVNSAKAMRGALVAIEQDKLTAYAGQVFKAYWSQGQDIAQSDVLSTIAATIGIDPKDFADKIIHPDYKQQLRDNTDELIARQGFGVPTIFIDGNDRYFGNDRLPLVDRALAKILG